MSTTNRSQRNWREWRRLRAVELGNRGWKQRDISIALDVSESSVSGWLAMEKEAGKAALRSHDVPGRPPRLTDDQLRLLPDFLWHGPEAYGFRGQLWTCERVAGVIVQEFGICYSNSQVSRLLKRLKWSPQVPITRAVQRDEEAVERWRAHTWPALREKARRHGFTLVFVDESGFYLLPSVVKTYAPQGQTPILTAKQSNDHLSVMGALTAGGAVYSLVRQEPLNGLHTIEFLTHLLHRIEGRLLVIWDRSTIHRRAEVGAFLAGHARGRIHIELLPPYAPDLNPVEWLWQNLKDVQLRNVVSQALDDLHAELHLGIDRLRKKPELPASFFVAAGLEP